MRGVCDVLNLVRDFDLRDNPNGGTYSLIQAAYLKLREKEPAGVSLTEEARRLARAFPIMCMISFLENCDLDARDRFIKSVGESKLAELKSYLVDGSYTQMYQYLSTILAGNNDGQDIKSLVENLCSTYKTNVESGEVFEDNQKENDLLIKYLEEELLG